jgi:hypothetical protein
MFPLAPEGAFILLSGTAEVEGRGAIRRTTGDFPTRSLAERVGLLGPSLGLALRAALCAFGSAPGAARQTHVAARQRLLTRPFQQPTKNRHYGGFSLAGGEGGIRTHEGLLTLAGFQDRCIQPLCHLSEARRIPEMPLRLQP